MYITAIHEALAALLTTLTYHQLASPQTHSRTRTRTHTHAHTARTHTHAHTHALNKNESVITGHNSLPLPPSLPPSLLPGSFSMTSLLSWGGSTARGGSTATRCTRSTSRTGTTTTWTPPEWVCPPEREMSRVVNHVWSWHDCVLHVSSYRALNIMHTLSVEA